MTHGRYGMPTSALAPAVGADRAGHDCGRDDSQFNAISARIGSAAVIGFRNFSRYLRLDAGPTYEAPPTPIRNVTSSRWDRESSSDGLIRVKSTTFLLRCRAMSSLQEYGLGTGSSAAFACPSPLPFTLWISQRKEPAPADKAAPSIRRLDDKLSIITLVLLRFSAVCHFFNTEQYTDIPCGIRYGELCSSVRRLGPGSS